MILIVLEVFHGNVVHDGSRMRLVIVECIPG